MTQSTQMTDERTDLLAALARHRHFLRFTLRDLTDEQAARRTTSSQLCLGGLIKHVADAEAGWVDFILDGPTALTHDPDERFLEERAATFRMLPGETVDGVLADYERVAARTEQVMTTVSSLDDGHLLPDAPWFETGARWSARRVLLHILAETAQHAGHADIIRESLDGAKTMA